MSKTAIREPLDKASTYIAVVVAMIWFALKDGSLRIPTGPQELFAMASEIVGFAASAVFAFRFLFEKRLWRWRVFRGRLVRFPDLSGTWYASSESLTYRDPPFRSIVTIKHDFDRLYYGEFRLREGEIVSVSEVETWSLERIEQADTVRLFVVYTNKPGFDKYKAEHGAMHQGCVELDLLHEQEHKKEWILKGKYWTTKEWAPLANVESAQQHYARSSAPQIGGTQGKIQMRWRQPELASMTDEDALIYLREDPTLAGSGPASS
ncbi:hypothetical protein [Cupriavidus sp. CP313]